MNVLDADVDFPAVAQDDGAFRPQAHERANGGGGAALGARLQSLAEHDEGDDGGGALKVKMPVAMASPRRNEGLRQRVQGRD
jgi:hypothetical protein